MTNIRKTRHQTNRQPKSNPPTKRDNSRAILVVMAVSFVAYAIILVLTLKL